MSVPKQKLHELIDQIPDSETDKGDLNKLS